MSAQDTGAYPNDDLWSAYTFRPDRRLREQLIEQYRPVALAVLRHLGHRADEDLEQVALLGLVKAVDRFNPASGYRFSTFAVPTIMGEIKRYQRDHSRMVRPPRWLFDLHNAVLAKESELTGTLGRAPTLAEIAGALAVEIERVIEAMAMEEQCHPQSLDGLMQSMDREWLTVLEECLGAEDPELARVEARVAWEQVLQQLPSPLRAVLVLRYYHDLTQKETAQRLGVSQMQVSRLERRALSRLRGRAMQMIRAIEELPTLKPIYRRRRSTRE